MNIHLNNKRELGLAVSLAALLVVGLSLVHAKDAIGHQGMRGAMHQHGTQHNAMHKGRHGKGHDGGGKYGGQGKGYGKDHAGHHGKGHAGHHAKGHGGHHLFGDHWKKTLSAEQKVQLDWLHLEFAKKKHTLRSGIQALKVQLAAMAIADQPQAEAVEAQINELLMAKKQLMQAKYHYIAAQRKVLTQEQRVSFDMDVIHKADAGKAKGHHGGGHH